MYLALVMLTEPRDVKLLSFGGDQDGEEETETVAFKKKNIARPDCECTSQRAVTIAAKQKVAVIENPSGTVMPMPEALPGPPKTSKEQLRERALEKETSLKVHLFSVTS